MSVFLWLALLVIAALAALVLYGSKLFGPKTELWIGTEATFTDVKEDGSRSQQDFPSFLSPNAPQPSLHLSVVVPAYLEQNRLQPMMTEAIEHLKRRQSKDSSFTWEVIVVDDGSTDNTSQVALGFTKQEGSDKVRVLTLKKNRGKGGALRRGVICSRGRYVLMADADGATRFEDLDGLEAALKKIQNEELGMVLGSRAHLQDKAVAQRSLFRTVLMYGFHFLVNTVAVRGIRDTQCGFKLFTRQSARVLFPNLYVERWAFDIELILLAQQMRMPIQELAVNWTEIPGSKLSPIEASLQMFRDVLRIRFGYLVGFWKIDRSLYRD